jgi:hypothetical protein
MCREARLTEPLQPARAAGPHEQREAAASGAVVRSGRSRQARRLLQLQSISGSLDQGTTVVRERRWRSLPP